MPLVGLALGPVDPLDLNIAKLGLGLAKLANFENFKFFAKFCKFLAGSFSALSERNFARKYAFDSIFHALQDLHTFAPLQFQIVAKNRFEKP